MSGHYGKDLLKSIKSQSTNVLGDEFWNHIADLMPKQGPRVDAFRSQDKMYVIMELPGSISPDNIHLSLQRQSLRIKGEIPEPYRIEERKMILSERFFGAFDRKIPFPPDVIPGEVKARYELGLLIAEIQIMEETEHQPVPIHFQPEGSEQP
jgi:HSP20 family protein